METSLGKTLPPLRRCRYCESPHLTKEHALAKQLADLIPRPASMTAERLRLADAQTETLSEWATRSAAYVEVRDFCKSCNGGFMADLDTAIKSEFAELVVGTAVTLFSDSIARWAAWATKQFLSYQAAYPDDLSRPDDFHTFFRTRKPLPETHIYLGVTADVPWPHLHSRRPLWGSLPSSEVQTIERWVILQIWTAVYGHLVIQVVQRQDPRIHVPLRPAGWSLAKIHPDAAPSVVTRDLRSLTVASIGTLTKIETLLGGSEDV
jgi:hypothetical protein